MNPDPRMIMKPAEEDLNIPRRELLYIKLALNRVRTVVAAAALLGITERNLHYKKKMYGIYRNRKSGLYEQRQKI
jgi:transcriptional regulator with GAF, ATPase, and Fis domain